MLAANGSTKEFNFLYSESDKGLEFGIFALYEKKLNIKDVKSLTVDGSVYAVKNSKQALKRYAASPVPTPVPT